MSITAAFIYKSLWWIIPGAAAWAFGVIGQHKNIF